MRLHNPTDEFVAALLEQEYIEVEIDGRSIELHERCPGCHSIVSSNGQCLCDWLEEPIKYEVGSKEWFDSIPEIEL